MYMIIVVIIYAYYFEAMKYFLSSFNFPTVVLKQTHAMKQRPKSRFDCISSKRRAKHLTG